MGNFLTAIYSKLGLAAGGIGGWLAGIFVKYVLENIIAAVTAAYKIYKTDQKNEADSAQEASDQMAKAKAIKKESTLKEQRDAADEAFKKL